MKQDKQDYTPVPSRIHCPLCKGRMSFNSSKHLDDPYDSSIMRMIFLMKCDVCEKQQWVYDDGEIRVSKTDLCPKCKKEIDIKANRKGKVITWKHKCKACGYTKSEIDDLAKHDDEHNKWQAEQKKKEEEDKRCLIKKATKIKGMSKEKHFRVDGQFSLETAIELMRAYFSIEEVINEAFFEEITMTNIGHRN